MGHLSLAKDIAYHEENKTIALGFIYSCNPIIIPSLKKFCVRN